MLGAGAIGAYYGGQLARAGHDVTLYARGENLTAIRSSGLEIRTPEGSTVVRVAATDSADELGAADFAILGVKSYSLDSIGPVVRRTAENGAAILPPYSTASRPPITCWRSACHVPRSSAE